MRPETAAERQDRHARTLEAYRKLVDPASPPRAPHLLEHHFFTGDAGDVTGLIERLEGKGFQVDSFSYDPDEPERTWRVVVIRLELLDEGRILALSDELDDLARQHDATYDGWLTHVE